MADSAVFAAEYWTQGKTLRTRADGPSYLSRSPKDVNLFARVAALGGGFCSGFGVLALATDFPKFTLRMTFVRG
jgi:hypothetical protein